VFLTDGNTYRVQLQYDAGSYPATLYERVFAFTPEGFPIGQVFESSWTDAAPGYSLQDLPAILGGNYAYFGFTGATGGFNAEQQVSNFFLNGQRINFSGDVIDPPPPPPANQPPDINTGEHPYVVREGEGLTLGGTASDPDGDSLSIEWDLNGDNVFTDAFGTTPSLTWQQLVDLGIGNGPATYVAMMRVGDGHGHVVIGGTRLEIENAAPTATFYRPSGEGDLTEGTAAVYAFANAADPSAADQAAGLRFTYAADFNKDGVIDATEEFDGSPDARAITFPEDGNYNVRGRVYDRDGGYSEYFLPVVVHNMAPTIESVSGPTSALPPGGTATLSATFHDDGHLDTHTAVWDWGDGTAPTPGVVTQQPAGGGTVGGSHLYAQPGLYTVKLTVTDDEGAAVETLYRHVVVYAPAGRVAGDGTVQTASGRGTFAVDVSYKKGATTPSGIFTFKAPGLDLRSTGLAWLVARGSRAYFRGTGTVNGQSGYAFQVTFLDGGRSGAAPDRIRVKVWNTASNAVVFDTQPGALDDADPTTLLTGGVEVRAA
jgi:PKD repeat protein